MTGPSPIRAARDRHLLADVARRIGIHLDIDTGTVTVRCPLPSHGHPDRTPSLRLYLDGHRYYCFGCAAKGDVIQWAQDTQHISVAAAIRVLDAGRPLTNAWAGQALPTGVTGPRSTVSDKPGSSEPTGQADIPDPARTPAERVHAALCVAWDYYTSPSLHVRAAAYLTGRGIHVAVLEDHTGRPETGHTPARPDGLVRALRSRGFDDHEMVDAGLARRSPGGGQLSDFYRQRVLIPIRHDQQRIAGLIGRNIGDQQRWPKYKNPPRTAVYDKSVNLYQPLTAPTDPQGQVVIVEGTLDAMAITVAAIRAGQAHRFCPITQSGRELSSTQLNQILTMHPAGPVLGFDADVAGQESTARLAAAFAKTGRPPMVAVLPQGEDPASWLRREGVSGLRTWSRESYSERPSATSRAERARLRPLRTRSGRARLGSPDAAIDVPVSLEAMEI